MIAPARRVQTAKPAARKRTPLRNTSIALEDATAGALRALQRAHEKTCALAQTAASLAATPSAARIADAAADAAHLVADAAAMLRIREAA